MEYDVVVFIGRFQIFHMRHLMCVLEALKRGQKVIILIGSSHAARSFRQPFTFVERKRFIEESVAEAGEDISRLIILPLEDRLYDDDAWIRDVQFAVAKATGQPALGDIYPKNIALIGYEKDHTGYFLQMFPEWSLIPVKGDNTSSTYMRNMYFSNIGHLWAKSSDHGDNGARLVTTSVKNFLVEFMDTPEYKELYQEYEFVTKFSLKLKSMASYGYESVTFNTADILVTHGNKILLVKRTDFPGRNLWSLPQSLISPTQSILGAARERLQKYGISAAINPARVFDNPERDPRGRFIAHVHHVKLNGRNKLPPVNNAQWWALSNINRSTMFSDHMNIIDTMLGGNNG